MALFDNHKNFAVSAVATAPSPAASGTSLVVTAAQGARFPTVPFNATVWPAGASPTPANAEVVRVTARSTDTLTITRAQEGTSARTIVVGDQIAAAVTAKTLTDIEAAVPFNVNYYGAAMNGSTDDTAAIQAALDACAAAGGGVVQLGAGAYRCTGTLIVPPGVTLKGVNPGPSRGIYTHTVTGGLRGTELQTTYATGGATGTPFITLRQSSALVGVTIYHPNQTQTNPPVAYPYAVAMAAGHDNAAVIDVTLINAYQGINCASHGKGLIRNVHGQPLLVGINIDDVLDVMRVQNVHFWMGYWKDYDAGGALEVYCRVAGSGIICRQADEVQFNDLFFFGYANGVVLWTGEMGGPGGANGGFGSINNLLVDSCTAGIIVVNGKTPGWTVNNYRFIGQTAGYDACALNVVSGTGFSIQISNGQFQSANSTAMVWLQAGANAINVILTNCTFQAWNTGAGSSAIRLDSPSPSITAVGCTFITTTGYQFDSLLLSGGTNAKIFTGCRLVNGQRFRYHATSPTTAVVIAGNATV